MTSASVSQNILLTHGLINWLVSQNAKHSVTSKIKYQLAGRAALIGSSLLSLVEAVGRAAVGCVTFIGCWQQAKDFGSGQIQKGGHAASTSLRCFRLIFSLTKLDEFLKMQQKNKIQERERRVIQETTLIANKLRSELAHAKEQADQEHDKAFQYLPAPAEFKEPVQSERIAESEVGICHYIGRRDEMEDEHLTTSFNLIVGGKTYPVQLFGIFDGHAGGEASQYVKKNLEHQLHETLNEFCIELTDKAIWNALKITFVTLNENFKESHKESHKGFYSGTTATVAMILDKKLWTANIGDSRTILDNGTQLSEDAKPSNPRYQKSIEKRGDKVSNGRVNRLLSIARAVGDHDIGTFSARPKITVYPLSEIPQGSHLILACDGICDVASTRQVATAVREHKDQSAAELAKNIVYSAFQAGSLDNLSALVVKL